MAKAKFASVFLSHSWKDKPLVEAVLEALGRRGVVAWIDKKELSPGMGLRESIVPAIRNQTSVVAFLSPNALRDDLGWVNEELRVALNFEGPNEHWLIPVYMGEPSELVNMSPVLQHWAIAKGNRVDRLGIAIKKNGPLSVNKKAEIIADGVTKSVLGEQIDIASAKDLILVLDQRGVGVRMGRYSLAELEDVDAPVLVFRPNAGKRDFWEVLTGDKWIEFRDAIGSSLEFRGASRRRCSIRILGQAQLGLAYYLGTRFCRGTDTVLHCYNTARPKDDDRKNDSDSRSGELVEFTNKGQSEIEVLSGGDPYCYTRVPLEEEKAPDRLGEEESCPKLALYVGAKTYLDPVRDHMRAQHYQEQLLFIEMPEFYESSQVMHYVANVVACIKHVATHNQTRTVRLYCGLPFHVVPILAANLTYHLGVSVEFMERCSYADEPKDKYVMLPMD